jgi:hypothetical protein
MPVLNALPNHLKPRREKVFGFARGFAHDRNARIRIETYVMAWNAKHKQEGQHQECGFDAYALPDAFRILAQALPQQ